MMDSQGDTGAESEGYPCIRASSTEVNRRRQHRTSTEHFHPAHCSRPQVRVGRVTERTHRTRGSVCGHTVLEP